MDEVQIVAARAFVMTYDDNNKKWVHSGTTAGLSKVNIYHHQTQNTFRIVGRKLHDHELVINCSIQKSLKYNTATPTFHQWRDQRQIYGLNFSSSEDADTFAKSMYSVLETLNASATIGQTVMQVQLAGNGCAGPKLVQQAGQSMGTVQQTTGQPVYGFLTPEQQQHLIKQQQQQQQQAQQQFQTQSEYSEAVQNGRATASWPATSQAAPNSHIQQQLVAQQQLHIQQAQQQVQLQHLAMQHAGQINGGQHVDHLNDWRHQQQAQVAVQQQTQVPQTQAPIHSDIDQMNMQLVHMNMNGMQPVYAAYRAAPPPSAGSAPTSLSQHQVPQQSQPSPQQSPSQVPVSMQDTTTSSNSSIPPTTSSIPPPPPPPPLPPSSAPSAAPTPASTGSIPAPPPPPPLPGGAGTKAAGASSIPPPPPPPQPSSTNQAGARPISNLASALANAKLKKTPVKDDGKDSKVSSGGLMDEMQKTLARRARERERQAENGTNGSVNGGLNGHAHDDDGGDSHGRRNGWESKSKNSPNKDADTGPHSRLRTGSVDGSDLFDVDRLKQEILLEVKKEINKAKQEIIDVIRNELSKSY